METEIFYGVVVYRDTAGTQIVACHPSDESPSYLNVIIATMMDLTSLDVEKISVTRDRYTVHLLNSELHYACVTRNEGSPVEATSISGCAQEFLERVRSVYRELPILMDLSHDIKHLTGLNLSEPLGIMMQEQNQKRSATLTTVNSEHAEVRKILLDSVQELVDRGEKLDELVRRTQTLEIKVRKDFRLPSRLSKKKKSICLAVFAAVLMLLSGLAFSILVYIQMI